MNKLKAFYLRQSLASITIHHLLRSGQLIDVVVGGWLVRRQGGVVDGLGVVHGLVHGLLVLGGWLVHRLVNWLGMVRWLVNWLGVVRGLVNGLGMIRRLVNGLGVVHRLWLVDWLVDRLGMVHRLGLVDGLSMVRWLGLRLVDGLVDGLSMVDGLVVNRSGLWRHLNKFIIYAFDVLLF